MHAPLWTSRMQQSVIACDIPIIVCGKCVQFFSSSSFSLCDSDSFSLLYISSVGFFSLIHFLPWFFASFFVWFFSYLSFFSVLYKVCLHFFNMDCFFHFIRVSHYLNLTFFFIWHSIFYGVFLLYALRDFWSAWILRISFSFTIQRIIHVSVDWTLTGFKMCFWIIYVGFNSFVVLLGCLFKIARMQIRIGIRFLNWHLI